MIKTCIYCGKEFETNYKIQKICKSDECEIKLRKERSKRCYIKNHQKEYSKKCFICKAEFKTTNKRRILCGSQECKLKNSRIINKKSYDRIEKNSERYKKYISKQIKQGNKRRKIAKVFLNKIRNENPCCICGEKCIYCLDFHHIDPKYKKDTLLKMAQDRASLNKIKEELNKCVVLCANCHRKLHRGVINLNGEEHQIKVKLQ